MTDARTRRGQTFTVINNTQGDSINFLTFKRKYIALRPRNVNVSAPLFFKFNTDKYLIKLEY